MILKNEFSTNTCSPKAEKWRTVCIFKKTLNFLKQEFNITWNLLSNERNKLLVIFHREEDGF